MSRSEKKNHRWNELLQGSGQALPFLWYEANRQGAPMAYSAFEDRGTEPGESEVAGVLIEPTGRGNQ